MARKNQKVCGKLWLVTRYIVYFVAGLAMGQKYLLLTIDIIYGKQLMAVKIAFSGPICPLLLTRYSTNDYNGR